MPLERDKIQLRPALCRSLLARSLPDHERKKAVRASEKSLMESAAAAENKIHSLRQTERE